VTESKLFTAIGQCAGLMLCWLTMAAGCLAADGLPQLRISVPDDGYPPYVIRQDDQLHGILIDPMYTAAQRAGIELEFVYLPELRSLHMLESGQIDGRMESPYWTDQPDNYQWSDLVVWLEDVLVYRNDQPFDLEQEDGLLGGEIIFDFAFALLVGVLIGTYSSIYVASPLVLRLNKGQRPRSANAESKAPAPEQQAS